VAMEGWERDAWFEATAQRWVNPSPNMRNLIQASLYAGIGAIEVRTFLLDVARTRPLNRSAHHGLMV
jgi:uncharacterized protein YbbC (DUF1343 family)